MLTPLQVQRYNNAGYVTVPGFFTDAQLWPVIDYMVAHESDKWTDKRDDQMREAHYHQRDIFAICTDNRLLDAIESLLGPDLVLLYTHLINKKPGGLGVLWHQDGPYWPRVEPKVAVSAWVALDDADAGNGCMRVIPGSHRGCIDYGQQATGQRDLIQDHAIALPPGVVDVSKAEDIVLHKGDLSLHHSYLIHGSEPNHSARRRAALTIRYVPASTRIAPREDRRQYLVRGREADNGNVYSQFKPLAGATSGR